MSPKILLSLLSLLVLAVLNGADNRRPIWNIAHMVNTVKEIDYYLNEGANAIEFDIFFSKKGFAENTYHGVPCDCGRSCLSSEKFDTFLQHLRKLTTPGDPQFRKELVMLFMDFKVKNLKADSLTNAGMDVAKKLLQHYWKGGKNQTKAYILISLPLIEKDEVIKSFLNTLEKENATEFISRVGLDFNGNEDISAIKKTLESDKRFQRNWLGDGISNCLHRGDTRLKAAIKERDQPKSPISKVYWWTLDTQKNMRKSLRLGIDGVITNKPGNLLTVLKEESLNQSFRLATFEDNPWTKYNLSASAGRAETLEEDSTFYDLSEVE